MLICVEGLTNSGKTTLCRNLTKQMPAFYINDLLRSDIVTSNIAKITNPIDNVDKFSIKTELLLYLSMLSQKANWIEHFKNSNEILLVDRFSLSVFVQFCNVQTIDRNYIRELIGFSANYIIPDYTIFLDTNLDTIMKRANESPFSRKDLSLPNQYDNMRKEYLENIEDFSQAYQIINCDKDESKDELTSKVIRLIDVFESEYNKPIWSSNKNDMIWISAGGKGTRLKEFTTNCPKPLLKIGNYHLIEYICKYLISKGFSNKIFISYSYLKEMWKPFVDTYKNHICFSDSTGAPNLVADLLLHIKNTSYDNYIIISGDVIFDFSIIIDLLEKHKKNGNDLSIALNHSAENLWKSWDYIMDDSDNILDIVKRKEITHIERYCLVVRRKTIEQYTSSFLINMGIDSKEFKNYEKYNSGWTYLVKRIIDCGKFSVKGYFYDDIVININAQNDLMRAKEYLDCV